MRNSHNRQSQQEEHDDDDQNDDTLNDRRQSPSSVRSIIENIEASKPLPENQLRRKSSSRRKSHHRRSSRRRSNRRTSGQESGKCDGINEIGPSRSSFARDEGGIFDHGNDLRHDEQTRRRSSSSRNTNRRRSSGSRAGHHRHHGENENESRYDEYSFSERSDSPNKQEDELESSSVCSLPTVFRRSGVGGSIRDDLSEITNMFSPKKILIYDTDDSMNDDDDSTIDSCYKRGSTSWCTIMLLIFAVIAVGVGTALLIAVGVSQDLPSTTERGSKTTPDDNTITTSASPTALPTPAPTRAMNVTLIRPIIQPPSRAECTSIAAGKEYYGDQNEDPRKGYYFAIDMEILVKNHETYGGNTFVNLVLPEIQLSIQSKLLPLLIGCNDEWTRRRRRLVTEYPILNAKVIKLYKKNGRCIETPVSCYKISVEVMLTFIEAGPMDPIVLEITELFTEQNMVQHLGLEFIIRDTDTTDVRALDSPPSNPPSLAPSDDPSTKPTIKPTESPTRTPTTLFPTETPSKKPSKNPTMVPSWSPTRRPTASPSRAPTPRPTVPPTAAPTLTATGRPTVLPSVTPSKLPSTLPSMSVAPSSGPSNIDSQAPTTMRSNSPTVADSSTPSADSSSGPSLQASNEPTVSPGPSFRPIASSPP